jgi:hypothetical protein
VPAAGIALWLLLAAWPAESQPIERVLSIEGVTVHMAFDEREMAGGGDRVLEWLRRSLHIVASYYDGFPVRELTLVVRVGDGARVAGGTTFGEPRPLIRLRIGRDVSARSLEDDWVLVHEMIHLALPDVGEEHAWLSEGLATYVEGIARARAGNRAIEDVWAEDVRSMPRGLPAPGDAGLDHTHTWGRTYWGGALFCLLADLDIRRETHNRQGLADALSAVARASGGLTVHWPIERVLAVGDRAVGVDVLERQYRRMKDQAVTTDLPALWRDLGVIPRGESVALSSDAPLAGLREALTRPRS